MSPLIQILLLFLLLLLIAVAIGVAVFLFQRYNNPEPTFLQQRLTQIKGNQKKAEENALVTDALQRVAKLYKGSVYSNEVLGKSMERFAPFRRVKLRMHQAGMLHPDQYILKFMLIPFGLGVLVIPVIGVFAIFGTILLPTIAYLNIIVRRGKRYEKFITQLPDALSMMNSALRAGHAFQSAMSMVSTEMGEPMSTEFSSVVKDINLGIPVKEALSRLVDRLETLPDVRMFSTAVTIQREAGGNLAEVLEKLGHTIRERFKLKRQIAALTGQSRMTGYVLGAAPFALLAFLSLFMYNYVKSLYETNLGHYLLVIIMVMQCIGFFVMKKIIDIRV